MDEMLSFTNLEGFEARMRALEHEVRPAARSALHTFGEAVMEDAKNTYVPVEFGALRDSGRVEDVVEEPVSMSVRLAFGNPLVAPKAIAIHEHLSGFSPPTWRHGEVHFTVGGPKYLELPVMKAAPHFSSRVAVEFFLGLRK